MSPEQSAVLIEAADCQVFPPFIPDSVTLPIVVGVRHSRLAFHSSVCVAFQVSAILVDESPR